MALMLLTMNHHKKRVSCTCRNHLTAACSVSRREGASCLVQLPHCNVWKAYHDDFYVLHPFVCRVHSVSIHLSTQQFLIKIYKYSLFTLKS
jgi:hypothetical protein